MRSGPNEKVDRADPLTDHPGRPGDPPPPRPAPTLGGEEARQGRIILNTPTRRWIFFGGLVAFVLFVLIFGFLT
jgi:hypothetical protein